ncbi:TPA: hypothetical protein ACJWWH_002144, partial [Streptococcus pneumoniae]
YQERMQEADQIIFLNFLPLTCLFRAFKRYLKYRGKVRESMAADCPERFDWEFIRWILWDGRSKTQKENYQKLCQEYSHKVTIPNHSYLSQLDVTYKTPDLMSHFLPPH